MAEGEKKKTAGHFKKELKREGKKLDDAYKAMGVRAYRLVKDGKIKHSELTEVSAEIDAIIRVVDENRAALEEIQAQKKGVKCPYCDTKAAPGAKFCPGCGKDLPEAADLPSDLPRICPHCGSPTSAGRESCASCGKKMPE